MEARREGDTLVLTVEDDGPGPESTSPQPGSGTGLSNTRERLAQMYGDRHTFTVGDAPGGGTRVRMELPAKEPSA